MKGLELALIIILLGLLVWQFATPVPVVNCDVDCPCTEEGVLIQELQSSNQALTQQLSELSVKKVETIFFIPEVAKQVNCYQFDGLQFSFWFGRFNQSECPDVYEDGVLFANVYDDEGNHVSLVNWTINQSMIDTSDDVETCGVVNDVFYILYNSSYLDSLGWIDLVFYGIEGEETNTTRVYYDTRVIPESESICLNPTA